MKLHIFYLQCKKMLRLIFNLIRYGKYAPNEFVILNNKKLIYLVNSKVACSSIKATFLDDSVEDTDDGKVHDMLANKTFTKIPVAASDYEMFTFVRNPFDRLVSCYLDKFIKEKSRNRKAMYFDDYLFGYFCRVRDFSEFARRVCKIPNRLCDRHFAPQYLMVKKNPGLNWGKLETIDREFIEIQTRYHLRPLPHLNSLNQSVGDDWRKFYNQKTALLVYKFYKKDFELFGYQDTLKELMDYIQIKK